MKKLVLVSVLFASSFASAQTFKADLETARIGEAVLQVNIEALKTSAQLQTVSTLEMIDQGVEGDFLCKNTLNFANAAVATISLQSRVGEVYASETKNLDLKVQDVVRTETKTSCAVKSLLGAQTATLATQDLFANLVLKQDGKKRLVLRVDFFYMNKGLSVETAKTESTYSLVSTNFADLAANSNYRVTLSLVEETTDEAGRVSTLFLEHGYATIRP